MMIKNIIYAILLGVGMAACLSERDGDESNLNEPTQTIAFSDTTATEGDTPFQAPENLVIQNNSVGNVKIGMPITQMREQVPAGLAIADTTLNLEGQPFTAYVLHPKNQEKGILVEQLCEPDCRVWRITVKGEQYKTPSGLGVGSKFAEIQKAYPISSVTLADAGLVAVSEKAGISFILENSQVTLSKPNATPTDIPANTLVRGILVY
ncbi:mechanosensitive ion channel protein MscS [Pontibacter harenae]|uniref:mechanosensitive ion channel protein MscS n=1 Tax=Pontibacter harenae TaxID=2894083 RepID=UPI001E54C656|nr:mechanosensitive ion channel protein MscS [Pontibacter harenae]MCC9166186.1 mechanosensitive ion channel protein MscS [Pontibacter harenae]